MDVMEAIFSRRSIRQYTDEPLTDDHIVTLLKAGMSAPSAADRQPWQFVVINDRNTLIQITSFHQYSLMLQQAPTAILICGDTEKAYERGYLYLDCAAATQNILLAAHALGLGAVWLGIYPGEKRMSAIRGLLGLPQNIEPIALVAVGHPAEKKPPEDRFDAAKVHNNRW
jgi:nitroreductase